MKNVEKEVAAAQEIRRALTDLTETRRVAYVERDVANQAFRETSTKFFAGEVDAETLKEAKRRMDRSFEVARALDRKHREAKNAYVEAMHDVLIGLGLADEEEKKGTISDSMDHGDCEHESNVVRSST